MSEVANREVCHLFSRNFGFVGVFLPRLVTTYPFIHAARNNATSGVSTAFPGFESKLFTQTFSFQIKIFSFCLFLLPKNY